MVRIHTEGCANHIRSRIEVLHDERHRRRPTGVCGACQPAGRSAATV
jgi:hypothetical protein